MTHQATDPRCDACEQGPEPTALAPVNAPGLDRLAYRIGTHADFRASMIAALTDPDKTRLAELSTRDPGDFSIAPTGAPIPSS